MVPSKVVASIHQFVHLVQDMQDVAFGAHRWGLGLSGCVSGAQKLYWVLRIELGFNLTKVN